MPRGDSRVGRRCPPPAPRSFVACKKPAFGARFAVCAGLSRPAAQPGRAEPTALSPRSCRSSAGSASRHCWTVCWRGLPGGCFCGRSPRRSGRFTSTIRRSTPGWVQRYRDGRPAEAALARLTPDDQPALLRARTGEPATSPNGETLEVDAVVIGSGGGQGRRGLRASGGWLAMPCCCWKGLYGRRDFTGSTFQHAATALTVTWA